MEWITNLFMGEGIAHSVLILALVITIGIYLGHIKIGGISFGITWILFVGIFFSHYGMRLDSHVLHFVREFGLILFVYSVGFQVGPGFFASFKKGGITLNMLAAGIVFLGVLITYIIHIVTGLPITTMVGILSGAVTNTPGMGAAQEAYADMTGAGDPTIALGYAVAYPLGVFGIIMSIISLRFIFRMKLEKEREVLNNQDSLKNGAIAYTLEVKNPNVVNKSIVDIIHIIGKQFVISRVLRAGNVMEIVSSKTRFELGDRLLIIATETDIETITAFIGELVNNTPAWDKLDSQLVSRRILVTRAEVNGRTLGDLKIRENYGVNVTRVNRVGTDLVARPHLELQMGDRVMVVGAEHQIEEVTTLLGNSLKRLKEPNLIPIFLGIFLGVFLGSIPFMFPGIPQPVKLGLAGGPLVAAILVSRFGHKFHLITYTTLSANLMLREIGISLFLACVGLSAGENFVSTIIYNGGYQWIGYGVLITVIPLLVVGGIGRLVFKLNYFTLMGLLAGSTTDPPALAYSNSTSGNDLPAVSYATVYPFTMFLRVLTAQFMILIFS